MSTGKMVAISVLVGLLLLVLVALLAGIGIYNRCASLEVDIKAQYEQNKNNYDNYFKKVVETSQVPAMYAEDMKKLYDAAMAGRYGEEGSKALLQFIQEQNPQLDPALYRQIQQVIEAGRNSFEAEQKSLIAKKQTYEKYISTFPGMLGKIFGFPKIDPNQYSIVTSSETEKVFKEKKSDPLKLRPENK